MGRPPDNEAWKEAKSYAPTPEEIAAALPDLYRSLVERQAVNVKEYNDAQGEYGRLKQKWAGKLYQLRRTMLARRIRMDAIRSKVRKEIIRKKYVEIQKRIGL